MTIAVGGSNTIIDLIVIIRGYITFGIGIRSGFIDIIGSKRTVFIDKMGVAVRISLSEVAVFIKDFT